MPFSRLFPVPDHVRERWQAIAREMERLHGIPDRELGEEILRLARRARAELPHLLSRHDDVVYDPNLVWHVAPELARRLGATVFLPEEASRKRIRDLSDDALRQTVGAYLNNIVFDRQVANRNQSAIPIASEILGHALFNGNPLAMAADRIASPAPANVDHDDWLARHTREIQGYRGLPATGTWTPTMGLSSDKALRDVHDDRDLARDRGKAAQAEYEGYDFGKLQVADHNGWEFTTPSTEWSRPVFIESAGGGDSIRADFTVVFKEDSAEVVSAYATMNGQEIGHRTCARRAAP